MGRGSRAVDRAMHRPTTKLAFVRVLYWLCGWIDEVAYRPVVVKLTHRLPWFWRCQFSLLSMKLDRRWGTGFWTAPNAPPAPDRLCDACRRRAAWLEAGGHYEGIDDDASGELGFLASHPVNLCRWCHLDTDFNEPPQTSDELEQVLREAGARSIGWRWRWRPG